MLENLWSGESFAVSGNGSAGKEDVMATCARLVQDDLAVLTERSIGSEDGAPGSASWATAPTTETVDDLWFRSERQTLRWLPRTGAFVFTVRTYFHRVADIADEDYVPGRLASAVRSWGDDVAAYKGRDRYGGTLLAYLDRKRCEQLERGLDPAKEDNGMPYPF